jgi:NAD(P)-dependent dehydrogenase (short-subunit alcohol dehydrogenase family)
VYCGLYGIDFEAVPLADDFTIRVDDYLARGADRVGAVIFPNPNAPTGRLLPLSEIARLAAGLPDAPIVVDEAYVDFGGLDVIPTAVALVQQFPNILVTQTLSKSRSLAGLRVGFAIGQPELVEALTRVKDSFNSYPLDRLALVGASAAMDDEAHSRPPAARSSPAAKPSPPSSARWVSRCCRPPPTSSSPATRAATPPSWPPRCASAASSCGTSRRRASTSSCASPWAPAQVLRLDITQPASIGGLGWQVDGSRFSTVIVNAGVYGPRLRTLDVPTEADFDQVMHTNVLGPMRVVPQLLEALAPQARLAVVSSRMGSIGGRTATSGWLYAASKAALNSVLKDISLALQGRALCVALHPGWVQTDMGGAEADLRVEDSARALRGTLAGVTAAQHGQFLNYDGNPIPW